MASASFSERDITAHTLEQLTEACAHIIEWNADTACADDYLRSSAGMQRMAASCMLIESIGEGVKKIEKLMPGFLQENAPQVPWKNIKGLRDHIAHGYFNLDADIIFDVAVNEIPALKIIFEQLRLLL